MKNRKDKVVPFYKTMISIGVFLGFATFVLSPDGELEFLGLYWPLHGLMYMFSLALFTFGSAFGLFAVIAARRAKALRMQQEAAADADKLSDSQPKQVFTKPAASTSSASVTTPEPRVMVLDKVAKPNLEFPTS